MRTETSSDFSSTTWYRLTNLDIGSGSSLDVVNDNGFESRGTLQMAATGTYTGQYWQIEGSRMTGFTLSTRFLGRRMVLEVTSETRTYPIPHLAPPVAGNSGQIWTISSSGDGTYRLSSRATGEGRHLDTKSDTKVPFMGDGDHSGQHWRITEIKPMTDSEKATHNDSMEAESSLNGGGLRITEIKPMTDSEKATDNDSMEAESSLNGGELRITEIKPMTDSEKATDNDSMEAEPFLTGIALLEEVIPVLTEIKTIMTDREKATHNDSMEAESSNGTGRLEEAFQSLRSLLHRTGSPTSSAPIFSSATWYRLTNLYMGPESSLDVVNDNDIQSSGTLQMAATDNYTGQYWKIAGSPTTGFTLCTRFLGRIMVLDVTSETGTYPTPHLAPPAAASSGQIWTISSWGDDTYRLSSMATGEGLHLDTYSDTKVPFMGHGDQSGQHWQITEISTITDPEFT